MHGARLLDTCPQVMASAKGAPTTAAKTAKQTTNFTTEELAIVIPNKVLNCKLKKKKQKGFFGVQ